MSNRIELPLFPSLAAGTIAAIPWIATLIACLLLARADQPWLYTLAPLAAAGASVQMRKTGFLRGNNAIRRLEVRDDQLWAELGNGHQLLAEPSPDSRIGGTIALLKLSFPASRYWPKCVVLVDRKNQLNPRRFNNVPSEPFRQLRVWLRLRGDEQR